jgi:hypothetical protein
LKRIQCDEVWSFVGAKQKNVPAEGAGTGLGDVWTEPMEELIGLLDSNGPTALRRMRAARGPMRERASGTRKIQKGGQAPDRYESTDWRARIYPGPHPD